MKIFTNIRIFKSELQTLDYIELYTGSNFSVAWRYEIDDIIKYFLNLTVCFAADSAVVCVSCAVTRSSSSLAPATQTFVADLL